MEPQQAIEAQNPPWRTSAPYKVSHAAVWYASGSTLRIPRSLPPLRTAAASLQFLQRTVLPPGTPATSATRPSLRLSAARSQRHSPAASCTASRRGTRQAWPYPPWSDGQPALWGLLRVAAAELRDLSVSGTSHDGAASVRHLSDSGQTAAAANEEPAHHAYADGQGADRSGGTWAALRLLPAGKQSYVTPTPASAISGACWPVSGLTSWSQVEMHTSTYGAKIWACRSALCLAGNESITGGLGLVWGRANAPAICLCNFAQQFGPAIWPFIFGRGYHLQGM